jgi:hypothetical protein
VAWQSGVAPSPDAFALGIRKEHIMRSFVSAATLGSCILFAGVAAAQSEPPAALAPPSAATVAVTPGAPVTTAVIVPSTEQTSLDLPAPDTSTSPVNRPLLVTSLVLLGGTYGASAIVGGTSRRDADKNNLFYPVVGPWMDYANRGCNDTTPCNNESGSKALLILDGVGQGLGAIGIVASLFIPERATHHWYIIGGSGFHAMPSTLGTGYGLTAFGEF